MIVVGLDVGSTTVKAVAVEDGRVLWRDYQRHNTRQAEKVFEFLTEMQAKCGLTPGRDLIFFTGSGAGLIAPLVGGKLIQEVVAVAAAVEKLHPDVNFVSEIGGEDMKTVFLIASRACLYRKPRFGPSAQMRLAQDDEISWAIVTTSIVITSAACMRFSKGFH